MAKRSGSSKGGANAKNKTTPSGVTYQQFMQMSVEEREQTVVDILNNDDIVVPNYLDDSATQKVMFALGMDGKPQLMSDAQLDKLPGDDLYRTVNGNKYLTAGEIIDQIKTGDYTRLSDSGGSAYGRGIYYANELQESLSYGYKSDAAVMRTKLLSDANIVTYGALHKDMNQTDGKFFDKISKTRKRARSEDEDALFALTRGIDGWFDKGSGYQVVLNRAKIATSKTTKYYNGARVSAWTVDNWNSLSNYTSQ